MDFDIFRAVTFEPRLCTLGELKTSYSLKDLRDFLEIIDVHQALEQERIANENRERAKAKGGR